MKHFRSIVVVGFVFPFVLMLAVASLGFAGWERFARIRDSRAATYEAFGRNRDTIAQVAPRLPALQHDIARLTALAGGDQATEVANALKGFEAKCDPKDARRTVYNKVEGGGVAGANVPCDALSVEWSGRFSSLQAIYLQAESQKPNLVLTELSLEATAARMVNVTQRYDAYRATISTPTQ